jgi:lysophospholipase L1-like esterase
MKKLSLAIVCVLMTAAWTRSAQQPQPLPDCPDLVRALQDMVRADSRIRDFADLRRYREANRDSSARVVRVVFMGDSITDFWNRPQFGGFFPGKPYADRGISGQTTPQMLLRFRPDVIALHPDVVVILAGTNDIAGNTGPMTDAEIEGNLTSMCELAQASRIRVVLSSITPVGEAHRRAPAPAMTAGRPPSRIIALNTWIRQYAAEHHHVYLDYYSAMVDDRGMLQADLSEDDLHPNAKGYAVMAPLAEAAVQRALAIAWR